MKRIIATITALGISAALLAGCASAANAQPLQGAQPEQTTSTDSPKYDERLSVYAKQKSVWEAPETGVTFKVPENIKDLKGQFSFADAGEVQYGDNIYICDMEYYPKTDKEAFNFYDIYYSSSDMTQELVEATQDYVFSRCYLASIVAVKEGKNLNEAENLLEGTVKELGTVGGYNYYYIFTDFDTIAQSLSDNVPAEMRAELKTLCEQLPEYPNAMTLTGPKRPVQATEIGTKVSFETTDLEGNTVKSEDLFKDHKVTMINLWGTNCDPCKCELPKLEKMSKELAEKDCQIIGICTDSIKGENIISEANKIVNEKGVTYTNIVATDDILAQFPLLCLPTTYFVDSEGNVLTNPVGGAFFDQYDEKIAEALASVEK